MAVASTMLTIPAVTPRLRRLRESARTTAPNEAVQTRD